MPNKDVKGGSTPNKKKPLTEYSLSELNPILKLPFIIKNPS